MTTMVMVDNKEVVTLDGSGVGNNRYDVGRATVVAWRLTIDNGDGSDRYNDSDATVLAVIVSDNSWNDRHGGRRKGKKYEKNK